MDSGRYIDDEQIENFPAALDSDDNKSCVSSVEEENNDNMEFLSSSYESIWIKRKTKIKSIFNFTVDSF